MMHKRKHERYPLQVPIRLKRSECGLAAEFEASSRDISSSGVYISIDPQEAGLEGVKQVQLELTLTIGKLKEMFGASGKVILEIGGSVVRSEEDGIVIQFDKDYSIFPARNGS